MLVTDAVATALTEPGAPRTQRPHTQGTFTNTGLCEPFPPGVFDPRLSIPESDAAERIDEFCGGRTRDGEEGTQANHDQRAARADGQPRRDRGLDDQVVMPDMHPIVERLDESIRETIPGLQYAIKWKNAYYGVPELGWIIEM